MLEKTVSDEKHLEYAQKIIALADAYKQGFLRSLQKLNDEISLDLVEFRDLLRTVPKQKTTSDMELWLDLSRELHSARLGATKYANEQNEFDTFLPTIVVKNNGRSDMTLSPEESTYSRSSFFLGMISLFFCLSDFLIQFVVQFGCLLNRYSRAVFCPQRHDKIVELAIVLLTVGAFVFSL